MYWFSFLRPLSPSFFRVSSAGIAADINWMMMDALIYGMIVSAKTVIRLRLPPLNMSNMPSTPAPCSAIAVPITPASMPGTGT